MIAEIQSDEYMSGLCFIALGVCALSLSPSFLCVAICLYLTLGVHQQQMLKVCLAYAEVPHTAAFTCSLLLRDMF